MRVFLLGLSLVITGVIAQTRIVRAQEPNKQILSPSGKVASVHLTHPSQFELLHTRYRFENDGTGRKEVTARIRILNEQGVLQWSELTFDYEPFSEQLEIPYVRVVKENGKVADIVSGEVVKRPNIPTSELADVDYDEKRITVRDLSPRDVLEYKVVTIIQHPWAQDQFYVHYRFEPSMVVDEQLEIDIPSERAVKIKAKPGIDAWVGAENRRQIYRWRAETSTLEGPLFESALWRGAPDIQLSSFANWEEVGRWYANLERTRRVPSATVRAKADELTRGLTTELQKIEALYDFAAKKIRYMSLATLGVGGYAPHSADETIRNQYGDCKDKAALLAALLEAEGLHASSTLINPDRKLDLDIPSPWPFTHVITMLQLGKDEIWMDPSAIVLPFRMLPYALRKKQALVMPPDGTPHFEETPADAPVPNTWLEDVDGKVGENGTLDATVRITARGDAEIPLRQAFLTSVKSGQPLTVHGSIEGLSRDDKVSDVEISDPMATNEPFTLSCRISKRFFVQVWKKQFEIRLPFSGFYLEPIEGNGIPEWHRAASEAMQVGPTGKHVYKVRLDLGRAFTLKVPPNVVLERDYSSYYANYQVNGSLLTAERELVTRKNELSPTLAEDYGAFRQKVLADTEFDMTIQVARWNSATQK